MAAESKCPMSGGARTLTNRDWWPNHLNLEPLHQHSKLSDPMGEGFDYAQGVQKSRPEGGAAGSACA